MSDIEKRLGHYLGSEIDEKWWKRYAKDGLLARGVGNYWMDDETLFFHRHLTKDPIAIPLSAIEAVKIGKWHSGRWAGGAHVLKVVWKKGELRLSSGIVVARDEDKAKAIAEEITVRTR